MISTAPKIDLERLERKLDQQSNPEQRLLMLNHLIGQYVFTDLNKVEKWLQEQAILLQQFPNADLQVGFLLHLAYLENQRYDDAAAEGYFKQALAILDDTGNARQIAEILIDYAGTLINLVKYEQVQSVLKKVERLLKNFPEESLQARMICRKAFLHLHFSEYTKAADLFNQADSILNQIGSRLTLKDFYFKTLIHSGLGSVYQKGGDEGKGIASQRKVLQICEENGLRNRLSWHYLNLGKSIMSLGQPRKAEPYFRRAIEHRDDNSKPARASALANLGYCLFRYGQHAEALNNYNQAVQAFLELSTTDFANLSTVENWRGQVYMEMGDPKSALKHYQQSYQYAIKTTDYSLLSSVFKQMANLYAELEDYKQAYEYQQYYDKAHQQHLDKISKD
ncbi:MAG: tetratricopeptide repeat protein, partial [Saprospiraceae bacterium]